MPEARALVVQLGDRPIGRLEASPALRFVPTTARPLLSIGDTSGRPWSPAFTRAWFEGLLPEGELRTRIAARHGVEPLDTFDLLAAIGWECAGAVTVMPAGAHPPDPGYRPLTNAEVGERLDALPGHPFEDDDELRLSLGGQQDKLVLARRDETWWSSVGGAPTTHLLKPEPAQWPGLAFAEAWSLRLVSTATTAAVAWVETALGDRPVLVVERYDRTIGADGVQRRHQEDVCQALGLLPSRKYAEPRGRSDDPSFRRVAALVRTHSADAAAELRVLLRQMIAQVVLMNADAHAKNLSLLHDERGYIAMSPVYDIVPTTAFVTSQKHLGMSVDGGFRIDRVTKADLVAEAGAWGMPASVARADVLSTIRDLDAGVAEADAAFPAIDPRVRLHVTGQLFRLLHRDD